MTQPPDDAALVARIKASVTYGYMPMAVRRCLSEAATALEAKDRRIAELEARLKPFAEIAHGEVYERFKADSRSTFRISNGDGSRHLTFINAECFDASRAALEPSDRGGGGGECLDRRRAMRGV